MDHSTTFARHFARLVYLLLHEPKNIANQKAALRLLVAMSKEGDVTLTSRDWHVLANGAVVPQQLEGVPELGAQLIGHAVTEIVTERNAVAADLLGLARALATEPVPGGEGESIVDKLVASGAKTVLVKLGGNAPLPRRPASPTPVSTAVSAPEKQQAGNGASRNTQDMAAIPAPSPVPAPSVVAPPPAAPQRRPSVEMGLMRGITDSYLSQFAAPNAAPGSISGEFSQLDATTSVNEITRLLDGLAATAEGAFREGNSEMLALIMAGIVKREANAANGNIKRAYGAAVRRLAKKAFLAAIAPMLATHREMYDDFFPVFARTGDEGAEVLIEQLNAAQSLADRRVYFDSLRKVNGGVKMLIHHLDDSRWYVVRNAADLLGEMSAGDAEPKLTELLRHDDDRVRKAAVSALSKMPGAAAVKGLAASLDDEAPGVRVRAAAALGNTKTPQAANALIKHLEREEEAEVQHACLASLGKIGSGDAIRFLTKAAQPAGGLFRKKSTAYRVAAVRALGEARTPTAMGALQNLLHDKEKDVREAVFWAVRSAKSESG
jgi:HEAT repeat protein